MLNSSTISHKAYEIPNSVKVSAPDNLRLMTPFILQEQKDWFEEEIRWMRLILEPGMNILDIGANYGTYALSAANRVGPKGKVWAIEPTPAVVEHLENSKQINGFGQMEILPCALGIQNGETSFYVAENAEVNALTKESDKHREIRVKCRTLDSLSEEQGIDSIDFLKLDAEGQETNIIEGGKRIFEEQSPIVLFENEHGSKQNLDCWRALKKRGYSCYSLCPATNVLVPIDPENFDGRSRLNLLACKPDKADWLEGKSLLCKDINSDLNVTSPVDQYAYKAYLQTTSYGRELEKSGLLDQPFSPNGAEQYVAALNLYASAMEPGAEPIDQTKRMVMAFELARASCATNATFARMLTLIRISYQIHRKDIASHLVFHLAKAVQANEDLSVNEPFYIPHAEYDSIDASGKLGEIIQSSIIYQRILLCEFSAYFDLDGTHALMLQLDRFGFKLPETEKRRPTLNQIRAQTNRR